MKNILTLLALFISTTLLSQNSSLLFTKATSEEESKSENKTITKVLATKINEFYKYSVTVDMGDYNTKEEIQKVAENKDMDCFSITEVNSIGDIYYVNISIYATNSGREIFSKLEKSSKDSDIDETLNILAKKVSGEYKTGSQQDIYSVSSEDSRALRQIEGNNSYGAFLFADLVSVKNSEKKSLTGIGVSYTVDARDFIIDIIGQLGFSSDNFDEKTGREERLSNTALGIDVLKPLEQTNNSFYFGGGLYYSGHSSTYSEKYTDAFNYTYYNSRTDNNSGLLIKGHFGYILNRIHSTNIKIAVSPYVSTYKLNDRLVYGASLKLGVNF